MTSKTLVSSRVMKSVDDGRTVQKLVQVEIIEINSEYDDVPISSPLASTKGLFQSEIAFIS